MMGYFVYFVYAKSGEVINSPYNTRQELLANKVVRGKILSKDGHILAETKIEADGKEVRSYPYAQLFAHAVGYSVKGKMGLEANANFTLLTSNTFVGEQVKNSMNEKKNIGDNVVSTLDMELQQIAYDSLGIYQGAILAMEPKTGKILAMVSKPDFDPNIIDSQWEELTKNSSDAVLVNRCTQGLYPPGSTFKIITALEYIRENPSSYLNEHYLCTGQFVQGGNGIRCYRGQAHGDVDLTKAFAKSCNSSFANMGLSLNRISFLETLETLLFNQDLELPFASNPSQISLNNETTDAQLIQASIGQGTTLMTPIHMAMITSAVANDGEMMKPYLMDHVQTYKGSLIKTYHPESMGQVMDKEEAEALKKLMAEVVETGTGTKLKDAVYTSVGKTGSAEYSNKEKGESHAWFTGFAPAQDPQIAVTVIIEKAGSGGDYAVPVAKRLFDAYLN